MLKYITIEKKRKHDGNAEPDRFSKKKSIEQLSNKEEINSDADDSCHDVETDEYVATSGANATPDKSRPKPFASWKTKYPWLTFDCSIGKVFCLTCCQAVQQLFLQPKAGKDICTRKAFVDEGFCGWKNALQRFANHERSEFHMSACDNLLNNKKPSISEHLSNAKQKEMHKARTVLEKIASSAIHLARQGSALRGDKNGENSNIMALLRLRAEDVPELKEWLTSTAKHKWLHHTTTDEILQEMSFEVLRKIRDKVKAAKYYSIIADEATDSAGKEQMSLSIRYVQKNLTVEEDFVGLYETDNTQACTLFGIIKDVITRLELNIDDLRGQCYDGAANMSGEKNGVQTQIRRLESRALFVHCRPHTLNLVVQDSMEKIPIVKNFLGIVRVAINFIRDSPKRSAAFEELISDDTLGLVQFCPTRWCVRIKSLKRMQNSDVYTACLVFFDTLQKDPKTLPVPAATARGFIKEMKKFEFYFLLTLVIEVLQRAEILNVELQKCELSFSETSRKIKIITEHLEKMRLSGFPGIWAKAVEGSKFLDLGEPEVPRVRKPSRKIDTNPNNTHTFATAQQYYAKIFNELVDQAIGSIKIRFESETSVLLEKFEKFVTDKDSDVSVVMDFYKDDFDEDRLILHRQIFFDQIKVHKIKIESLKDVIEYLKTNSSLCEMASEYVKLVKILLTVPASSCTAERSFSAMRRLKTYLRSTMSAKTLNYSAVLHIHSELTNQCFEEMKDAILNRFIEKNNIRKSTFAVINTPKLYGL